MRFKLDENLPADLLPLFSEGGHDVATVRDEGLGGAGDADLFDRARSEDRTLVTLDLDFANPLRFPVAGTAGIVVLRVQRPGLSLLRSALEQALPRIKDGTVAGKLWIVEATRIREHSPESEPGSE